MSITMLETKLNKPSLRFNGFNKNLHKCTVGDLYSFLPTYAYSRTQLTNERGEIGNIHYGDIHTRFNTLFEIKNEQIPYIAKIPSDKKYELCNNGDLVVADASEDYKDIGKCIELIEIEGKAITAGLHTFLLRNKLPNRVVKGFASYLFRTDYVHKQIMRFATGISVLGISKSNLSKVNLFIPDVLEQQKIADFLMSVDNWIDNLKAQKESLEKYKKGMMQKLFSREIRFKDANGNDFPDWETMRLGDVFDERDERNGKNEYQMLSVSIENGVTLQDLSVKKDSSSKDKSNYKVVYENDLVYNTMRMWQGSSGVSIYRGIVSPAYTVATLKRGNVDFYGYLFKLRKVIFDFFRFSQGLTSDTWNLKFHNFSKVVVTVPNTPQEQQKIADFLSSVNSLIELKQTQIENAEQWKKGLMQEMFV